MVSGRVFQAVDCGHKFVSRQTSKKSITVVHVNDGGWERVVIVEMEKSICIWDTFWR